MKAKALCGAVSVVVLACASSARGQEMLTNGGFENEPNWGAGLAGNDGGFSAFLNGQLPGWTIAPGHAVTVHNTVGYPYITPNYSINLDGEGYAGVNADLWQDFPSLNGDRYNISYAHKGWYSSTGITMTVTVTDLVSNATLFSQTTPWTPAVVTESSSFLGTGNPLRMRVYETTSGYNDNQLIADDFSVVHVPEPAMMSLVAGTLIMARRRRI